MTSINFKVFALTRPGFKPMGSRLKPAIFRCPDLPERKAGTLLIQPPSLVSRRKRNKESCYYVNSNAVFATLEHGNPEVLRNVMMAT